MQYPNEIDDREKSALKKTSEDGQERTNMVELCIGECNIPPTDEVSSRDCDKFPVTEMDATGSGQQSLGEDQTAGFESKCAQQMNSQDASDGDRNTRKDGIPARGTPQTLQTISRLSSAPISEEASTLNIQMNESAALCGDNSTCDQLCTNNNHTENSQSEVSASSQHCTVNAIQLARIEDGSVHIPVSPYCVTECCQQDQCCHSTNFINNIAEMKANLDREMAATDNLPRKKPQNTLPIQVSTGLKPHLVEKVSSCDGSIYTRTTAGSRVAVSCEDTRHDTDKINSGFHDYPVDRTNDGKKQKPPGEEFVTTKTLVRCMDKKEMELFHPCDTVSYQQHEKDESATATNLTIASELSEISAGSCPQHEKDEPATATNFTIASELSTKMSGGSCQQHEKDEPATATNLTITSELSEMGARSCPQHEKDEPATATNLTIASELSTKMSGGSYQQHEKDEPATATNLTIASELNTKMSGGSYQQHEKDEPATATNLTIASELSTKMSVGSCPQHEKDESATATNLTITSELSTKMSGGSCQQHEKDEPATATNLTITSELSEISAGSCPQHEKDEPATATNLTIASELIKTSGCRYREMIVNTDVPENINIHSADATSEGTGPPSKDKDNDSEVECQIQIPKDSIPQYEDCKRDDNKTLDVGDHNGSGGMSRCQLLVDSPLKRKTSSKEGTNTSLAKPYLKGSSEAESCEDQISVNRDVCGTVWHPKHGDNIYGTANSPLQMTSSCDVKTSIAYDLSGEKQYSVTALSIQGPTAHIKTGEEVSVNHDAVVNPILCFDKEASIGSSESKLSNQQKDSPKEKQPKAKEDPNLDGSLEWRNDDDDDHPTPIAKESNLSHARVNRKNDQVDHDTDKSSKISSKEEKTNSTELNSKIEATNISVKAKPQVAVPIQVTVPVRIPRMNSQTIESPPTCNTKSETISEQKETTPTTNMSESEPYNLSEPKENSSTTVGELNAVISSPVKEMKLKAYIESMKLDKCTNGVTPLHLASAQGYLDAIQVLVEEFGFDPTVRDSNYQETPLHCACQNGHLSVVKYFINKHCCDVEIKDMSGLTPLHYASRKGHLNVVEYLSNEQNCNLQARDKLQQTALHYACHFGYTTVVRFFVQEKRCDPEILDGEMRTPLHLACEYRHSEIVQYLVLEVKCNPNSEDIKNMTPLHYTCIWWKHLPYTHDRNVSLDVAEALLKDPRCDVNKRTNDGNTALHLACKTDRLSIVRHLLFNKECNPNIKNRAGELPLHLTSHLEIISELTANGANPILSIMYKRLSNHDAVVRTPCLKSWNSEQVRELTLSVNTPQELFIWLAKQVSEHQAVEAIQSIIEHTSWNFNGLFSNGYNTLHIACKANKPHVVNCLLSLGNCNPNTNTRSGNSPLELSSNLQVIKELLQYGAEPISKLRRLMFTKKKENYLLDIVKFLTEEAKWEVDIALQLACEANRPKVVQFLLAERKCDPNSSNSAKRNLLQLTSNPEIIKILLHYGANPTDVYRFHSKILGTKQPLRPSVKVFIVGNPSVGKSTLTAALQNEPFLEMLSIAKKVSGVDEKTAGVIPYEFHSRKYGRITMYDFAGHREFYGSHAALLSNAIQSSPPIFILVVNVNEDGEKIKRNIQYWLSFIENQCSSLTIVNKPHVIIVGSHADLLQARGNELKEKQHFVDMVLKEVPHSSIECVGFVTMNCCYSNSPGMKKLRNLMKRSCSSVRSQTINFTVHCFQVYLQDKFRDHVAIRLKSIQKQVQSDLVALQGGTMDTTFTCFIPSDLEDLCKFCKELSDQGHILYLHNSSKIEEGWIIIDKDSLLTEVTGTVFAPSNFKEHRNLASSTGVVPFSKIKDIFGKHDPEMIVGYLSHLEFCHEILDADIVKLIDKHQTYVRMQSERCFFFPALVTMKIPDKVWKSKPQQFTYHCGWLLQCIKPERFFTSRFLEVLLLRLAFSFALAKSPSEIDQTFPAIQRECSIWKNGIFWGSKLGPEVLVEICFNEAVIILMRCEDIHLMKCIEGRPKIIFEVLKCAKEFCPKVQTQEFFIDPSEVTEYPLIKENLSELTRYPIEKIAKIAINSGEMESLVCTTGSISLRHLLRLEPYAVLKKQLTQTLLQESGKTRVSDTLLNDISECGYQNANFIKMFDSRPGVESSEVKLYYALRKWRDESEGTFFRLRDKFSQYTIFAGRELDMLSMASIPQSEEECASPSFFTDSDEVVGSESATSPLESNKYAVNPGLTCLDFLNGVTLEPSDSDSKTYSLHLQIDDPPSLKNLLILKGKGEKKLRIIDTIASEWEELAIALGFDGNVINYVKKDYVHDSKGATSKILGLWLENEAEHLKGPISWSTLLECLDDIGYSSLSNEIHNIIEKPPTLQSVNL